MTYTVTGTNASGLRIARRQVATSPGTRRAARRKAARSRPRASRSDSVGGAITPLTVSCARRRAVDAHVVSPGRTAVADRGASSRRRHARPERTLPANTTTGSCPAPYTARSTTAAGSAGSRDRGDGHGRWHRPARSRLQGGGRSRHHRQHASSKTRSRGSTTAATRCRPARAASRSRMAYWRTSASSTCRPAPAAAHRPRPHRHLTSTAAPLTRRWVTLSKTPCDWGSAGDGTIHRTMTTTSIYLLGRARTATGVHRDDPGRNVVR